MNAMTRELIKLQSLDQKSKSWLSCGKESLSIFLSQIQDSLYDPLTKKNLKELSEIYNANPNIHPHASASFALALNVFKVLDHNPSISIPGIGWFSNYRLIDQIILPNTTNAHTPVTLYFFNKKTHLYLSSKYMEHFYGWPFNKALQGDQPSYRHMNDDFFAATKRSITSSYNIYDASQIIGHALDLYRDVLKNPARYVNKEIVLLQLVWEMNNSSSYPHLFKKQLKMIEELNRFAPWFNTSMKNLFKERNIDFSFIYMNYHDFLRQSNIHMLDSKRYQYVVKNYVEHVIFSNQMDQLKYYLASLQPKHFGNHLRYLIKTRDIMHIEQTLGAPPYYLDKKQYPLATDIVMLFRFHTFKERIIIPADLDQRFEINNAFNYYYKLITIYFSKKESTK